MKKFRFVSRIGIFLLIFGLVFGGYFYFNRADAQFARDEDDLKCPAAPHEGLASVCGIVRSSSVDPRVLDDQNTRLTSHGVGGVTVALYEAADTTNSEYYNPTGKFDGALGHLFSSTYTTRPDDGGFNGGRFQLYKRRMGPAANLVYLAYFCNGQLVELRRSPSYIDEPELIETVYCPSGSVYSPPPTTLDFVDVEHLACDMQADPNDNPVIYEAQDTTQPQTFANFFLNQDGFDIRSSPVYIDGPWIADYAWRGGYWRPDCQYQLPDLLDNADLNYFERRNIEYQLDHGACEWDPAQNEYILSNVLPLIPYEDGQLAYRRLEQKADHTYYQEETAVAQFLHTHMGECWGEIFARKFQQQAEPQYVSCEEFLQCNRIAGSDDSDRNSWTTGGYATGMGITTAFQDIYDSALFLAAGDDAAPICEITEGPRAGTEIFVQDIQPGWSHCEIGSNNCDFELDRRYWHNLLPMLAGDLKFPFDKVIVNDSLYANGVRDRPVTQDEHAYLASEGGEGAVFTGSLNSGRLLGTPTAISVTTDMYGNVVGQLTNTFHIVGATDTELTSGHESGRIGGSPTEYCGFSFVNDQGLDIGYEQEMIGGSEPGSEFFYRNNAFEDETPERAHIIEETPTSGVFYTSTSSRRDALLASHGVLPNMVLSDFIDSLLTAEGGDGIIQASEIPTYLLGFYNLIWDHMHLETNPTKSMFDREYANWGQVELRDDMTMSYESGLTERNFEDVFPPYDGGGLEWSFNGVGYNECYPWQTDESVENAVVSGEYCNVEPGPGNDPVGVMRTCRVDRCWSVTKRWVAYCQWVNLETGVTRWDDDERSYPWELIEGSCEWRERTGIVSCYSEEGTPDEQINHPADDAIVTRCLTRQLDNESDHDDDVVLGEEPICSAIDQPYDVYYDDEPNEDPSPGGRDDPESCDICDLERAGPYGSVVGAGPYTVNPMCRGDLDKDANMRLTQVTMDEAAPDLVSNRMRVAENEFVKTWVVPGSHISRMSYGTVGGLTSVSTAEGGAGFSYDNAGKDWYKGLGGGGKAAAQAAFAFPMLTNVEVNYPDTSYHCNDTNGVVPGAGIWDCPVEEPPEDIELEDLESMATGACRLDVTNQTCLDALGVSGLSYTFETVMNAAGGEFSVHPAVLLAYMTAVHNLPSPWGEPFTPAWNNALEEASLPWWGRIAYADCEATDAELSTNDIGPYDWIRNWFENAISGEDVTAALEDLSEGRSLTAHRCNFLDATFAAAGQLSNAYTRCDDSWETTRANLCGMMFGSNLQGVYAECLAMGPGSSAYDVWSACH